MKVSEVMTTEFETVEKDQQLIKALNLMRKKKGTTRLIVINEGKPLGILSFRDVADRLGTYKTEGISPKELHVTSAMSSPIISIEPNLDVKEAAKIMFDKRVSSLLVMEGDNLKGLLRKFDLLKVYSSCKKIKIGELMTENPIRVTESERVISARKTMMDKNISVLPVVNEENIVGIIDDETLADALARFRDQIPIKHQKSRIQEFFVGQIMKTDPPIIFDYQPLCDVITVFEKTMYKGIFVLDNNKKLVGIITLTDITKAIVEGKN
ncbi:MAG: CBS domain-containing protein [Candidatus Heimdallarchaeota archaeon]|nr:CBS domain-containing protein [Candidatus Heimdallarchaeota archaeon]